MEIETLKYGRSSLYENNYYMLIHLRIIINIDDLKCFEIKFARIKGIG